MNSRHRFLLTFLLCIGVTCSALANAPKQLEDGRFERGKSQTSWKFSQDKLASFAIVNDGKLKKKVLKLNVSAQPQSYIWVRDTVTPDPQNFPKTIKLNYKASAPGAELLVGSYKKGNWKFDSLELKPSEQWTEGLLNITQDLETETLAVELRAYKPGEFWFSDVTFLAENPGLRNPFSEFDYGSLLFISAPAGNLEGLPAGIRSYREWQEAGFDVSCRRMDKLSYDELKSFNCVMVDSLPEANNSGEIQPVQLQFETLLKRYLEAGGTAIVTLGGTGWSRNTPSILHFLKGYGASTVEEQLMDDSHVEDYGYDGRFCFTTNLSGNSEFTKGFSRLGYYGEAQRADAIKTTLPFLIADENAGWSIVASGENSAYSCVVESGATAFVVRKDKKTVPAAPAFIAERKVGRGRLLVIMQNPSPLHLSPAHFGNILWKKDDMTRADANQNRSFLMNAAKILCAVGQANGMTGYRLTQEDVYPKDPNILTPCTPPWSRNYLPAVNHCFKGIVGARSSYSDGKYTVAELCKAARESGLSFLCFTENLASMDEGKWKKLEADCRAESGNSFRAFPGLYGKDKVGNNWFAVGFATFPAVPAITPDGKRIDHLYTFNARNFNLRLCGFYNLFDCPNDFKELKQNGGMAVVSYGKDGKLQEDARRQFSEANNNVENYLPVAFDEVDSPEAIRNAVQEHLVNVYTGASLEELGRYLSGEKYYFLHCEWPKYWYLAAASGPELKRYGLLSGGFNHDEEKENRSILAFQLTGLQKGDIVRLAADGKDFRCYVADGPEMTVRSYRALPQMMFPHVEVERAGRPLVISSAVELRNGSFFNQCCDHQNTAPYIYLPDREGNIFVSGPPIEFKYKQWSPRVLVYAPIRSWDTGSIGLEHSVDAQFFWFCGADFDFMNYHNQASRHQNVLSAPGMMIVDEIVDRINVELPGGDCAPPSRTAPLKQYRYAARKYGIYGRIGEGQVNGQLMEIEIEFLEDVTLKSDRLRIAWPMYATQNMEICSSNQIVRRKCGSDPNFSMECNLVPGDYLGGYPFSWAGGGAVYALADNLVARIADKNTDSAFYIQLPKSSFKQGEKITTRLFFSTGGSMPYQNRSDYEAVRKFLGMTNGQFPAIRSIEGGQVRKDSRGLLDIEVKANTVLKIQTSQVADAPCSLPFRIEGFNPNFLVAYQLDHSSDWRYMATDGKKHYMSLYVDLAAHSLVAGHPLTASDPDVEITLNDPDRGHKVFEVYNPTAQPKHKVVLQAHPLLVGNWSQTIDLGPYESKEVVVNSKR